MKSKVVVLTILLFVVSSIFAVGDFTRMGTIPMPEKDLNNGGTGNIVTGDLDGDGNVEMFVVNDNTKDGSTETIPRIYKLEYNGTTWDSCWSAVAPIDYQNTWPALTIDDLDADGKEELIWGPVNSGSNPYRIVVYEEAAATGSDIFGIAQGDTNFAPNSKWEMMPVDSIGKNMRPTKFVVADIDGDGTKEIVFNDRKGYYHFGVCSVDDIPDNGDGSETWTMEVSGLDFALGSIENKWDVAVIGNNAYFPCELQIAKLSWNAPLWEYTALSPLRGGASFNGFEVCDVDNDGTKEIVTGEYAWGNYGPYGIDTTRIVLLQEDGDSLKHTPLFVMETSLRLQGGDHGDIDADGNMDFIFGSRYATPNASIYRVEYNGDGSISDPSNWELTYADTSYLTFETSGWGVDGIWGEIAIVNIDSDAELEVIYGSSSSVSEGLGSQYTPDMAVLDLNTTAVENLNTPETFLLLQSYPNPFNPSTTIHYELANSSEVSLTIYDALGRKVTTLVNKSQSSGTYEVTWNPTNVSSGIYYGQINAKDASGIHHVKAVKMTYMK
ncbi:MAG: FG-GAP-like repeat-containing protein [Candidatus Marinimicrobia bacterium]|jgi:hypothetical protein|nr:FG-GAP-like repeat-containing protein [Candidatus Neomarinimicrobiota bacterium]